MARARGVSLSRVQASEQRERPARPTAARESDGGRIELTDPRTDVAPGIPEAAIRVQDVDVQCVLQFTLIHAAGCALHRRTSRVIHRLELYFSLRGFRRQESARLAAVCASSRSCLAAPYRPYVFVFEKAKTPCPSGRRAGARH